MEHPQSTHSATSIGYSSVYALIFNSMAVDPFEESWMFPGFDPVPPLDTQPEPERIGPQEIG